MKKFNLILLFISLFFLGIIVNAKTVTIEDMIQVINNGEITKEFLNTKQNVTDKDGNKLWKSVTLRAHLSDDNALQISGQYQVNNDDVTKLFIVKAYMQEDGKTLKSVIEYNEKDEYHPLEEIEIHNLIPLWEIEASDGWKEIKEYVDKDYINKINSIIDRCYRKEMHACRTSVSTYGQHEYISDVEMNEEAANYVITKLEDEAKEIANDRLMVLLLVVAIILILVILVLKSFEPKPKTIKY